MSLGGRGAILARADDLAGAHAQVHATYAGLPAARPDWLAATERLHRAYAEWWEPIARTADQIRGGDVTAVDSALDLLEADPWCFSSGYAKELLLRRIGTRGATHAQSQRLDAVARAWVYGRPRREFRALCRVAPRVLASARNWAIDGLGAAEGGHRRQALWLVTSFPLSDLSEADRAQVRTVLREAVSGDRDRWRQADWLARVSRAVVTEDWLEQLLRDALDTDPPDLPALRLLASLPKVPLTGQRRRRVHELVLDEAERPSQFSRFDFEALARLSADDDLLERSELLESDADGDTAMHAWWISRQVLIATGRLQNRS